ncbi:MAG: GspE/PulE family protein [Arcobacteraceae bacterium]|nr:GspE/PulE family protein [Arcobacteraceae bacterium]MDY0327754.1 GspE/PulE family protein [Arcobacteraceae bacterium]
MKTLKEYDINYDISKMYDIDELREFCILPLEQNELYIIVAVTDLGYNEKIRKFFKKPIKPFLSTKNDILFELDNLSIKQKLFELSKDILIQTSENIIKIFVDKILNFAVISSASDIHIETLSDALIFRFRVDGVLVQFFRFSINIYPMISTIMKLYANLDITKRRLPQNGRFSLKEFENYDFRISTMPTISGESIVIRLLEKNFDKFYLDRVGFSDSSLSIIKDKMTLTQGMILVTGPTGSGKTTTLYSMIKELKNTNKKIITIEDPVEYKIDNITQISVNYELELTYGEILKNILRQDPDILLIGEIRDAQSLRSAIAAAMTGHLVLATVHTNDAISTIHRLIDLESESFLIASVLKCIIAQRLVRILCTNCKDSEIRGCKECNQTGYKSRTIISEVLDINDELSHLISQKASTFDMKQSALKNGFISISEDGMDKVSQNLTTQEELFLAIKS